MARAPGGIPPPLSSLPEMSGSVLIQICNFFFFPVAAKTRQKRGSLLPAGSERMGGGARVFFFPFFFPSFGANTKPFIRPDHSVGLRMRVEICSSLFPFPFFPLSSRTRILEDPSSHFPSFFCEQTNRSQPPPFFWGGPHEGRPPFSPVHQVRKKKSKNKLRT